jgi:hypothetical protein
MGMAKNPESRIQNSGGEEQNGEYRIENLEGFRSLAFMLNSDFRPQGYVGDEFFPEGFRIKPD